MTFFLSLDLLNVRLYHMNKYKTQQDDVNDFWGENYLATKKKTRTYPEENIMMGGLQKV